MAALDSGFNLVKDLFVKNGLQAYYDKYNAKLHDLFELHKQANDKGEILCIGVQKQNLDDMVYVATVSGYKVDGATASEVIKKNNQKMLDDGAFIDTETQIYYEIPDVTFFCLACSDIPGEYGAKYDIKSIHLAEPAKYAEYKQQRDELFKQMKKECKL